MPPPLDFLSNSPSPRLHKRLAAAGRHHMHLHGGTRQALTHRHTPHIQAAGRPVDKRRERAGNRVDGRRRSSKQAPTPTLNA